jgi:hypothetical protein
MSEGEGRNARWLWRFHAYSHNEGKPLVTCRRALPDQNLNLIAEGFLAGNPMCACDVHEVENEGGS